jgi:hypothetical protein
VSPQLPFRSPAKGRMLPAYGGTISEGDFPEGVRPRVGHPTDSVAETRGETRPTLMR